MVNPVLEAEEFLFLVQGKNKTRDVLFLGREDGDQDWS